MPSICGLNFEPENTVSTANFNWLTLKFTFLIKIFYRACSDDYSFLKNPSKVNFGAAAEVSLKAHLTRFLA